MTYDFDKEINRKNTQSLKFDGGAKRGKSESLLPLWVADMDFRTAQPILDALNNRIAHGIFGYSEPDKDYFEAVTAWFNHYFDWNISHDWIIPCPGVVNAIVVAINAYTKPLDGVLVQTPVYPPFFKSIEQAGRRAINNPLKYSDGKYTIDFEDFQEKIIANKVKLFILCSPHNPVGRVWTREELATLGAICKKHEVLVLSDEIHADFTFSGHKHHMFAKINPDYTDMIITCTAPSKTFNLAGLQTANIVISSEKLRKAFLNSFGKLGYSQLNTFGLVACEAAYVEGHSWLLELKEYLEENLNFLRSFLLAHIPKIKLVEPEGTYLLWLDFSELELSDSGLAELITLAGLWLNDGPSFGEGGSGFQRINIATQRSVLNKALIQLKEAIENLEATKS